MSIDKTSQHTQGKAVKGAGRTAARPPPSWVTYTLPGRACPSPCCYCKPFKSVVARARLELPAWRHGAEKDYKSLRHVEPLPSSSLQFLDPLEPTL